MKKNIISFLILIILIIGIGVFIYQNKSKEAISSSVTKKLYLIVETYEIEIPFNDRMFDIKSYVEDVTGTNKIPSFKDMLFEIKQGQVRAISSDCPNQVCVNTEWISKCGEAIICAPNKVALIIQCENNEKK